MAAGAEIDGVSYTPLQVFEDARGAVLRFLRADAPGFTGFGEVYFSEVLPGATKGWRRHKRQTQRYTVPAGRIRIVLYDDREQSSTRGAGKLLTLGRPDAYGMLIIPPLVWYAFTADGGARGLIANCTDSPHDPLESESRPIDDDVDSEFGRWSRLLNR